MTILIADIVGGTELYATAVRGVAGSLFWNSLPAVRMELLYFPSSCPSNLFLHPRGGLGRVTFDDPAPV